MSVSARRRLTRLVRTGSPRMVARAVRRQRVWRRYEDSVARAGRDGQRLLVGPFLGEVGFELLYWIPVVRRLLGDFGVGPERVTVLTRGGAGAWYGDLAGRSVEILDLLPPDAFLAELVDRRRRTGDAKQFFTDELDERLAREAMGGDGGAAVLHPLMMFSRMRFVLEGLEPPERALEIGAYGPLARPGAELPADCPDDFVAVKLYFSDSFPDDPETRALTARLLEQLAAETDVVVLTSGQQLDEHREWVPSGRRIHDASAWVTPQDNLAVQTAVVARARALVATYGGFSYLGPMLGVPTLAVHTREGFLPVHLHVMRAAYPDADYTMWGSRDAAVGARFAERVAAGAAR